MTPLQELIEKKAEELFPLPDKKDFMADRHATYFARDRFRDGINHFLDTPELIAAAGLVKEEWISVKERLPEDCSGCWFYATKFNKVIFGSFVSKDAFDRDNVFISEDGGMFLFDTVSHYIPINVPTPPIN